MDNRRAKAGKPVSAWNTATDLRREHVDWIASVLLQYTSGVQWLLADYPLPKVVKNATFVPLAYSHTHMLGDLTPLPVWAKGQPPESIPPKECLPNPHAAASARCETLGYALCQSTPIFHTAEAGCIPHGAGSTAGEKLAHPLPFFPPSQRRLRWACGLRNPERSRAWGPG